MAVCSSTFRRIASSSPARRTRVRRFIGVCFYRAAPVCARDVVMQGTCLTLVSRVTILPECMCSRAPPSGGRYRGEYSGYNGCCEHLRFSACETSPLSTLKSPRDGRINGGGGGGGGGRDNRWTGRDIS